MAIRLVWENTAKRDETIQQTSQSLKSGGIVAIPSDTVYELAADAGHDSAVMKLTSTMSGSAVLLAPNKDAVSTLFPKMDAITRRLVDRCWPGPLSLAAKYDSAAAEKLGLAATARTHFENAKLIPFRVTGLPLAVETMRQTAGCLLVNDNPEAGPILDADAAESRFGDLLSKIVDAGAVRFPQIATIAHVVDGELQIVREGVLSLSRLRRLGSQVIVFVCTGNTCRSPMAEAIFKRMLADELKCDPQDLPDRGYTVLSAGVAALGGQPATEEAVYAVRKYKGALEDHVSQGLTPDLIRLADKLIVMTRQHKVAIEDRWPDAASKTVTLSRDHDVSDPIGLPLDQYESTAEEIFRNLKGYVREVIQAS